MASSNIDDLDLRTAAGKVVKLDEADVAGFAKMIQERVVDIQEHGTEAVGGARVSQKRTATAPMTDDEPPEKKKAVEEVKHQCDEDMADLEDLVKSWSDNDEINDLEELVDSWNDNDQF